MRGKLIALWYRGTDAKRDLTTCQNYSRFGVWFSLVFTVSKYGYHLACCPRHHWVIFILLNAPVSSQQNKAYGLVITTAALMRTASLPALKMTSPKLLENANREQAFQYILTPLPSQEKEVFSSCRRLRELFRWFFFLTVLAALQALHSVSCNSSWFFLTRTLDGFCAA